MSSQTRERTGHSTELILMLLAVVPMMVSAMISLETGEGHWFQRSGSLMVLFSVAVEYHRRRRPALQPDEGPRSRPFWRSVPYICYASIFLGTLVWGYGDLLFVAR